MYFMNQTWIAQSANGVMLTVHAVPRASRNAVQGLHGDALKIRLHAPPADGKANEALISFLSRTLNIPQNHIELKSGFGRRRKLIAVHGLSLPEIEKRLLNQDSSYGNFPLW